MLFFSMIISLVPCASIAAAGPIRNYADRAGDDGFLPSFIGAGSGDSIPKDQAGALFSIPNVYPAISSSGTPGVLSAAFSSKSSSLATQHGSGATANALNLLSTSTSTSKSTYAGPLSIPVASTAAAATASSPSILSPNSNAMHTVSTASTTSTTSATSSSFAFSYMPVSNVINAVPGAASTQSLLNTVSQSSTATLTIYTTISVATISALLPSTSETTHQLETTTVPEAASASSSAVGLAVSSETSYSHPAYQKTSWIFVHPGPSSAESQRAVATASENYAPSTTVDPILSSNAPPYGHASQGEITSSAVDPAQTSETTSLARSYSSDLPSRPPGLPNVVNLSTYGSGLGFSSIPAPTGVSSVVVTSITDSASAAMDGVTITETVTTTDAGATTTTTVAEKTVTVRA